ncbi:IS66-like element accessory protein TnpA [Brucella endophytica]|nr:transposase [Brucella endophytica]
MSIIEGTPGGRVDRLEIVNTGRRRNFSTEAKLRIVAESFRGENQINATAQRHGISRSQLYRWRKTFGESLLRAARQEGFVRAVVVPNPPGVELPTPVRTERWEKDRMEIVSANGRRVIVGSGVDVDTLLAIVRGLETLR